MHHMCLVQVCALVHRILAHMHVQPFFDSSGHFRQQHRDCRSIHRCEASGAHMILCEAVRRSFCAQQSSQSLLRAHSAGGGSAVECI